jgi:phage terminase large subunit-like protein
MTLLRPAFIYDGPELPDPHGHGERAVRFLSAIKHPKSATGRFELPPFLVRIVRRIYGDTDASGRRRVRTVFAMIPRGGRKTSVGAALSLLHTIGPERVPAGQAVLAAHDRGQARIAFEEAQSIVLADRRLRAVTRLRDAIHRIEHTPSGAVLQAISSEAGAQHGRTPNFALCDELHAWRGRQLWDVLRTGVVKTPGSLLVVITTSGAGQDSVAYDIYSYAKRVQLGEIEDSGFLPLIWEAPAGADWRDEVLWHAVNPGLEHGFPDLDGLRQLAREAEERPAQREAFRQLHLNVWLDHSTSPFVEMAVYDEGAVPVDLDRHEREQDACYLGVDLSSTQDLTAVVAAWPDGEDGYDVHPWFFCPAANLRRKADVDGMDYPLWAAQDFIIPTPGDVVDYRTVERTIRDLCLRFKVVEIAFDPHLAKVMMASLAEDGYPAVAMRQGWISMAPAVQELERAIVARRLRHGGHPVLREHFARVAVETDKAGNKSFHKGKSRDRIDGAVAAAMAVGRAHAAESRPSIYEDRPLLFV